MAQLKRLATIHTLNDMVVVLAHFMLVLRQFTGQDDILIGVFPGSNREQRGHDAGPSVLKGMVPVRVDFSSLTTVEEMVTGVGKLYADVLRGASADAESLMERKSERFGIGERELVQVTFGSASNGAMGQLGPVNSDHELELLVSVESSGTLQMGYDPRRVERMSLEGMILTLEHNIQMDSLVRCGATATQ
jgi:hypothetical protein